MKLSVQINCVQISKPDGMAPPYLASMCVQLSADTRSCRLRIRGATISATNHIGHRIYSEFVWRHRVDTSLFRVVRRSMRSPLNLLVSSVVNTNFNVVSYFYSDNPFNIFVALLASFLKYLYR